jgi:hypothetical protein
MSALHLLLIPLFLASDPTPSIGPVVTARTYTVPYTGDTYVMFDLLTPETSPQPGPTPTPHPPHALDRSQYVISMQVLNGSKVVCTFPFDTLAVSAGRRATYRGRQYWLIGSSSFSPLSAPCSVSPGTYRLGAKSSLGAWQPSEPFVLQSGPKRPQ